MPTIRTTMRPDADLEVSESEALDLRRQGLLVEVPSASPSTTAAAPAADRKAAGAAVTKEG